MKECAAYELTISALIDGNSDGEEALCATDHLLQCETCRTFYLKARALDKRLAEVRPHGDEKPMPAKVWERIHSNSRLPGSSSAWLRRIPLWAPVAAAALFVLALGLSLGEVLFSNEELNMEQPLEIQLGAGSNVMDEERFVILTKELLEADRKYHLEMFRIMHSVTAGQRGEFSSQDLAEKEIGSETSSRESEGEGGEWGES